VNNLRVEFPIRRTIVTMGDRREKVLYIGDTVTCPRCGKTFTANHKTSFMLGDTPMLCCPNTAREVIDEATGEDVKIACGYKFNAIYAVHRTNAEVEAHDGI